MSWGCSEAEDVDEKSIAPTGEMRSLLGWWINSSRNHEKGKEGGRQPCTEDPGIHLLCT